MDGGNANTWRNHTYETCTLIAKKLFNVSLFFNNPNLVASYNYNVTLQKVKHS